MLSWETIFYGAFVSAVLAAVAVAVLTRERRIVTALAGGALTFAGAVAWNSVLHVTQAHRFFTDAPIAVFPVSWQDTGTGVWVTALTAVVMGAALLRNDPARRTVAIALVCGLAALVVDVYLY